MIEKPYQVDHLRLRALTLVETLADTGSLHQAARRMNTSQPALSVMLQEVERTLGGRLFERTRRGLVPTEMGAYLIRQARLILADLRRVQGEFASTREGRSLLRIGVLPLVMLEVVPQALVQLRHAVPGVQVEFREGAASELLAALSEGALDMVVGRMLPEFTDSHDLDSVFLFAESFRIIAGRHHRLTGRRRISWPALQAAPWIETPHNTALHDFFVEAFLRRGLRPPQPIYRSASFYSCIAILRTSDCLMMVPHEVARHFAGQDAIRILAVNVGEASAPFSIVKRRSRATTRSAAAFEKALLQTVRGRH